MTNDELIELHHQHTTVCYQLQKKAMSLREEYSRWTITDEYYRDLMFRNNAAYIYDLFNILELVEIINDCEDAINEFMMEKLSENLGE